jgi:hypothetical protein
MKNGTGLKRMPTLACIKRIEWVVEVEKTEIE